MTVTLTDHPLSKLLILVLLVHLNSHNLKVVTTIASGHDIMMVIMKASTADTLFRTTNLVFVVKDSIIITIIILIAVFI